MIPDRLGDHVLPCGHEAHLPERSWTMRVDPDIPHEEHWKIGGERPRNCFLFTFPLWWKRDLQYLGWFIESAIDMSRTREWRMNLLDTGTIGEATLVKERGIPYEKYPRPLRAKENISGGIRFGCAACPNTINAIFGSSADRQVWMTTFSVLAQGRRVLDFVRDEEDVTGVADGGAGSLLLLRQGRGSRGTQGDRVLSDLRTHVEAASMVSRMQVLEVRRKLEAARKAQPKVLAVLEVIAYGISATMIGYGLVRLLNAVFR